LSAKAGGDSDNLYSRPTRSRRGPYR